ncbi:MAG: BamA/TamA family outer membrane protein, partial [Ignavibacteriaceae bacterium]|nr:BamA/TamA family outer membrane protein [Ignavibacteriaceae bacterium]
RALVDIFFSLGKKYYIDSVEVTMGGPGKDDVSEIMLRDLTGIKDGDIFDVSKLTQAQVRLYRTGLFSYVRIYPGIEGLRDSLVPVNLEGNISMMNDLNPELIMNNIQNAFNFGVGLEYNRKNFFGGARRFSSRAQIYYQDVFSLNLERMFSLVTNSDTVTSGTIELKARVEQPYFLGQPIFASLELSALINKIEYLQVNSYKSKINFEFELPKFTFFNSMNLFYALELNTLTVLRDSPDKPSTSLISAGFGGLLVSTHVDNVIFPTEGSNYSLYIEEGNLLPFLFSKAFTGEYLSLLFLKTQATASYYFSLNSVNDFVFATKFSGGYLPTLSGDKTTVPYIKEFFVGGSNSVRGWASRAFPPQKIAVEDLDETNLPGGRIVVEGSFELRKRFGDLLGAAVFVDWGNTWKEISNMKISEVAVAAGFGFRFYTQIAAFRLDFGFKVYDPYDRTPIPQRRFFDLMQFHFGIGEAF